MSSSVPRNALFKASSYRFSRYASSATRRLWTLLLANFEMVGPWIIDRNRIGKMIIGKGVFSSTHRHDHHIRRKRRLGARLLRIETIRLYVHLPSLMDGCSHQSSQTTRRGRMTHECAIHASQTLSRETAYLILIRYICVPLEPRHQKSDKSATCTN